ncbi:MAG: coenzyme F420-0:L-glutamate ligase [Rickettsiaceae bacterium]
MRISGIKTHQITKGESLTGVLDKYVKSLKEESIVAITSKIISICESRIVKKDEYKTKYNLIAQEADAYLPSDSKDQDVHLTIKNNMIIPSAGIDESNGNGYYILYPKNIQDTAYQIWRHIKHKHQINHLGIIITDSRTIPLKRGVVGCAIGWCGFNPIHNYTGTKDIFGREMKITQINNLEAIAASAVFIMGEANEQMPIAVITELNRIAFSQTKPTKEEESIINIPMKEDIYRPILSSVNWVWNKH